jgi:hypothetical protein
MKSPQISLTAAILLLASLPIWLLLCLALPHSPHPFGLVVGPVVLVAMTCTLHILFRSVRDGWAWSMFLAAIIARGFLSTAAWISEHS